MVEGRVLLSTILAFWELLSYQALCPPILDL